MVKNILAALGLLIGYIFAMGDNVNYDSSFDRQEQREMEAQSTDTLSDIEIESFVFQEKRGKNVPIKRVKRGSRVVYINRIINRDSGVKKDITVKNPIPIGTKYVNGSAICEGGCTIGYSTDGGTTLSTDERRGESYNYIEFYFKDIAPHKEYRMGFRAIVQ